MIQSQYKRPKSGMMIHTQYERVMQVHVGLAMAPEKLTCAKSHTNTTALDNHLCRFGKAWVENLGRVDFSMAKKRAITAVNLESPIKREDNLKNFQFEK